MKLITQPGIIALALSGMLAGTSAWATLQFSSPSRVIEGKRPYLSEVKTDGELREGGILSIVRNESGAIPGFVDQDGDEDASIATIEWFILEPGVVELPPAGTGLPGNSDDNGSFTIPNDGSALGKQIGYRITATSKTGIPDNNEPLEIYSATLMVSQEPDGYPGRPHGTNTDLITDDGNDNLVDPASSSYTVRLLNDEGVDIMTADLPPQVNTTYTAQIIGDANGVDYTEHFKNSIIWKLRDKATDIETVVEPVVGSGKKQFKTQTNNTSAQAKHSQHLSEQGMEIIVGFDSDITSRANKP